MMQVSVSKFEEGFESGSEPQLCNFGELHSDVSVGINGSRCNLETTMH